MKNILVGLALTLVVAQAQADTKYGAFVGANSTEYKSSGVNYDKASGMEAGVTALLPLGADLEARTGIGYVEKRSQTGDWLFGQEYTLGYLEVPLTALYSFTPMFAALGGANLDIKVSDKCEVMGGSCKIEDAEELVYSAVVGARATFGEGQNNAELLYEKGMSDLADNVENEQSISLRYVYMF